MATKRIFLLTVLFVLIMTQRTIATTDTAKSYCVINSVTGEVVMQKAADEKLPMASTTKIMTLLVALENSKPDDIVTVSKTAVLEEGSSAYLKPGAKITMRDVCYGLMLNSGNDAAVAIAEHISGDVDSFVKLMNDTADKMGMKNTHFITPNGLHDDEHYTTATELAKITRYALKNETFREIVASRSYTSSMKMPDGTVENVEYINHNRLLKELDGCIGVKTGFTKDAGRCLVSAVAREGAEYIIVTLNDSDDWDTHKELCEKTFQTHTRKTLIKQGDCVKHAVYEKEECELIARNEFAVFVNGTDNGFEIIRHIPKAIDFPLNEGEKVGYIEIKTNGESIGTIDVVAERDFNPSGKATVENCFVFTFLNILRNLI